MDIRQRATEQLNGFEKMLHWLPGFKGYYARELRRDADKLQRDFIVGKLRQAKDDLAGAMTELTRQRRLDALSAFDALNRQLERLTNEVRYADRGYSGFFDLVKIKEAELDAVYEADAQLAEKVSAVADGFRELAAAPLAEGKLDAQRAMLGEINNLLARRSEILRGTK